MNRPSPKRPDPTAERVRRPHAGPHENDCSSPRRRRHRWRTPKRVAADARRSSRAGARSRGRSGDPCRKDTRAGHSARRSGTRGVASRETRVELGWVMRDSFLGIGAAKRLPRRGAGFKQCGCPGVVGARTYIHCLPNWPPELWRGGNSAAFCPIIGVWSKP